MPYEYSTMHEIIRSNNYFNNYFILLVNLKRTYSDYIDIIDEVENIEQVIITDHKIKNMLLLFIRTN